MPLSENFSFIFWTCRRTTSVRPPCPCVLHYLDKQPRRFPTVLSGNNLTRIPLLQGLGKLQILDLSKNNIGAIGLESFPPELGPTLRSLNLEGNRYCTYEMVAIIWAFYNVVYLLWYCLERPWQTGNYLSVGKWERIYFPWEACLTWQNKGPGCGCPELLLVYPFSKPDCGIELSRGKTGVQGEDVLV